MVARTETTTLSNEKTSLLLQALLDVKNDAQNVLHKDVEKLVDDFVDAQKAFIEGIDGFMHICYDDLEVDDEATVTTIINTCPEFLNTLDDCGCLPIHCVAFCEAAATMYMPLFARVGHEYGVGGKDGRGGLVAAEEGESTVLQICASYNSSSHEVMKALMEMDPPFFMKEDISKYNLLDCTSGSSLETLDFFIDLDPSCLFQKDENKNGSHNNANYECRKLEYLLKRALKYNARHWSVGGLFSARVHYDFIHGQPVEKEDPFLRTFISKYGSQDTWDIIRNELSPYKNIPILHRTIEHTPEEISAVISHFPHSLFLRDEKNRLPIHVALERGLKWSSDLVAIMSANMPNLNEKDPLTGYYPFALAAEEPKCDLKTIHYLLRMHPGQIEAGIDNDKTKTRKSKRRRVK